MVEDVKVGERYWMARVGSDTNDAVDVRQWTVLRDVWGDGRCFEVQHGTSVTVPISKDELFEDQMEALLSIEKRVLATAAKSAKLAAHATNKAEYLKNRIAAARANFPWKDSK